GFDVDDQTSADALASLGRPVVCAHHGDHLTGVSTVTTDNRAGGAIQARYLADRGKRAVVYVTELQEGLRSHQLRKEGFLSVLEPARILDGFAGYSEGIRAGRQMASLVRRGLVDAFACVNDLTALGVIQGLAAEGLTVPQDVAVVGYDNLVLTGLLGPSLPTVEARLPVVYTRALEVLAGLANGGSQEVHESVEPVLVSPP
ncbi:MAG TPA: substrate-binding domain-containing protein, partial [Spirochaetia bacterium]|nr:substrate-binding domain-containing protein [Spirochaetia bacterium]